jgi:hypothetical protein
MVDLVGDAGIYSLYDFCKIRTYYPFVVHPVIILATYGRQRIW